MAIDKFEGDYRFLSNFYPSEVWMDSLLYPSVEHAFQAAKTEADDWRTRLKLQAAKTPNEVKKLGQKVKLRKDWETVKVDLMKHLVRQKFLDPTLLAKLDATKGHDLIESNWWGDTYWGVCKGVGQNHLGKILMDIRDN